MTVSAWFSVHEPMAYGGIVGAQEDNGNAETGWVLGYDQERFYFALSTEDTNDGDGRLVFLRSATRFVKGRLYHVVGTYDGDQAVIYVNGKRETSADEVGGKIVYEEGTQFAVAGYRDRNEDYPHIGEIVSAQVYDVVAKEKWIAQEFAHNADLTKEAPFDIDAHKPFELVISPYLQFGTRSGITVMWETARKSEGEVRFGETVECSQSVLGSDLATIHEIRLEGLKTGTQYFYKTISKAKGEQGEQQIISDIRTFQTDSDADAAFAFAIISDTQGNPEVAGTLARMAWEHRPNFLLLPGDLVSTGGVKSQWVNEFFFSMEPLISRVPFFPVLGNHEQNAMNYYNYASLPEPEYFYTYQRGNAQFFMIDTNKKCDPQSEQYQWLKKELSASTAKWKFMCHHHPPYSSDENDYGDLWKQNKSSRGDLNARHLSALYDEYGVDVVWTGHIHSYERTWRIKNGRPVETGGPLYMITGGGGGPLETPGPFRTPFANLVRRGHHYAMVWINGGHFEFKAYDLEGQLFDTFSIRK
jgi:predicted phosphodiesterase